MGNIIEPGEKGDIVLLGFPHDEGIEINGGRPGARHGPRNFRYWLKQFGTVDNPELNVSLETLKIADAGDVSSVTPLEKAHHELGCRVEAILHGGGAPFIVGGGNDQSYPNAAALLSQRGGEQVGVINVDAHLDVRPYKEGRPHSGSSFRQLLEDSRFVGSHFIEFAIQGAQCSREHADYILDNQGRILWLDQIQSHDSIKESFRASLGHLSWSCPSIFVSFDLDSVASCFAPGVSCPGVLGLSAREAVAIAYYAGSHPAVAQFDLSEYSPDIEDELTGRLAAAVFYNFGAGFAERKQRAKKQYGQHP